MRRRGGLEGEEKKKKENEQEEKLFKVLNISLNRAQCGESIGVYLVTRKRCIGEATLKEKKREKKKMSKRKNYLRYLLYITQ